MGVKKKEKEIADEDVDGKPLGNIYQRLNKVMGVFNYVKKDKEISFGNNSYTVVGHDAVTKEIHPLLVKYGISLIPSIANVDQQGNRTRVDMSFRWINNDNPEDHFVTTAFAYGIDNQDKGIGKAWSICQRFTVLKTLHLETGDRDIEEYDIDAKINEKNLVDDFAKEVEAKISNDEAKELIKFSSGLGLEQDDVVESLHEWGWKRTTDVPVDSLNKFKDSLELKSLKKQPQAVAN